MDRRVSLPDGIVHLPLLLGQKLLGALAAQVSSDPDILRGMFRGAQVEERLLVDRPQSERGLPEPHNAGQT